MSYFYHCLGRESWVAPRTRLGALVQTPSGWFRFASGQGRQGLAYSLGPAYVVGPRGLTSASLHRPRPSR